MSYWVFNISFNNILYFILALLFMLLAKQNSFSSDIRTMDTYYYKDINTEKALLNYTAAKKLRYYFKKHRTKDYVFIIEANNAGGFTGYPYSSLLLYKNKDRCYLKRYNTFFEKEYNINSNKCKLLDDKIKSLEYIKVKPYLNDNHHKTDAYCVLVPREMENQEILFCDIKPIGLS